MGGVILFLSKVYWIQIDQTNFSSRRGNMQIPSVKIRNILFPTDLSDNARYAFAYAVSLADQYGSKITLLHILPEDQREVEGHITSYIKKEKWEEIKNSHYQEVRTSLTGKIRQHAKTRTVRDQFAADEVGAEPADEIVIKHGSRLAREIIRQIEECRCDLVVMGSRGDSSLMDVVMGSITEQVLKRSPVPVLVVRLPED